MTIIIIIIIIIIIMRVSNSKNTLSMYKWK